MVCLWLLLGFLLGVVSVLKGIKLALSLFVAFVTLSLLHLLPTSLVLRVNSLHVYEDGYAVFDRDPLYDNIVVNFQSELVTKDGRTCSTPMSSASYEVSEEPITFYLTPVLEPCLEVGSIYRVTRTFWMLWPSVEEYLVLPKEERVQ